MSTYDCLDLCRLCLVKDRVSVPIFEGEGDVRQIFLKITACLPVKVGREDKLPKKICDDCLYKVELLYDFWNTTANAEKQLLQWLGDDGDQDKQGYVSNVMTSELMKQETENRLENSGMRTESQQNNMSINMIDQIGLTMPIIMSTEQQVTSVPMNTSASNIQVVPGTSSQASPRGQKNVNEVEEETEEDENSDDDCDNEEGLNVKEENADSARNVEPSFVNVTLACDEAGPSGLQQKISEIPELVMAQTAEGDPKSGRRRKITENGIPLKTRSRPRSKMRIVLKVERFPESRQEISDLIFCDVCDFKCNDKLIMSTHLFDYHSEVDFLPNDPGTLITGTRKYSCNMCGMICASKESLNSHYIRKHTEKYEFKCEKCLKNFKIKGDLTTHLKRVHSEDPVVCDVCGKSCRDKHSLYLHQKYSHYKSKFSCEKCGKCLTSQTNLAHHMRYQHEQKERKMCEECGKTFGSVFDLKKHMRIHTGERPYTCKVCDRSFGRHSGLNQHLLLHTGKKIYNCDICKRSFAQKSGLIGHRKKHQGDLPPLPHMQIDHIVKPMKKE